ncbi:MAG: hypothetical protein M5U26_13545 [Planctomycetota bacterium]|nr:hypothetical protein [Planctomycetota bacterium]
MPSKALLCLSFLLPLGAPRAAAGDSAAVTLPRCETPPALDGNLDDACWAAALPLRNFSVPNSAEPPAKPIEARLCFDARHLYVAVTCGEPEPAKLKAEAKLRNEQVWTDDCVELWIRVTSNALDFDQFIVNSIGTQEEHRRRRGAGQAFKPAWEAQARVGVDAWTVELKLPAADLGWDGFRRGDLLELKLGREDHTDRKAARLAVWPPAAPYAGTEGFGRAYLEDANAVANPDLKDRAGWSFSKGDETRFQAAEDEGAPAVKIDSPARYATMQQDLRLRPNAAYRLSAEAKAGAPCTVRARVTPAGSEKSVPHDLRIAKADGYRPYSTRFTTGPDGKALLILGTTEESGTGTFFLRKLAVVREGGSEESGPPIPLEPGAEPAVVSKLLVADCRAVRGFIGNPVDGTLKSGKWDGGNWEYNQPGAGSGVGYACRKGDGLHIAFAGAGGFNAVVVRGGIKARLYRDVAKYDEPSSGALVHEFPGQAKTSRAYFPEPVPAGKVSFFDVTDGVIADCSFYRVSKGLGTLPAPRAEPARGFAEPADAAVKAALAARFGPEDRKAATFGAGGDAAAKLELPAGRWVHLLGEPLAVETPLAAVGIDAEVSGERAPLAFSVRVQDPLNPRLELHGADYALSKAGRLRLVCDFPDQLAPAGTRLWISLCFDAPATLANLKLETYAVPRDAAAAEALAYRKLLLKGFYANMSEARPWNGWGRKEHREEFYANAKNPMVPWVREIEETIEQCRAIDKDGQDDVVRQYHQWFHRRILEREKLMPPYPTRFDARPGLPEWAVLAHQAWMQAREIPKWWIERRMTPNGEFGGEVGDDTDLLQNFAPFPMFERDGVGAMVLDAGARLAEEAERSTLEAGLNRRTMDPLHAYEEGINHEALMAWWHYGDPVYLNRCLVAARSTEKLTVVNAAGHRHFKSQDCGAADLRMDRKTDTDGHAHPLMWHPALELVRYNRHPKVMQWLDEWSRAWLAHQQPGAYATSVEVATDAVKASEPTPFAGGYGGQASVHMALAQLTGDKAHVAPFNAYLAEKKSTYGNVRPHLPEMLQDGLLDVPEDVQDALLAEGKSWPFALYRAGDKQPLVEALKRDVEELQRFGYMYTDVECFTDRVFLYAIINPSICYTGGYATRNKLNHNFAVSWDGFGTGYAALVLRATRERLKVLLCNLSDEPLAGRATVWRLAHANYALTFGPDADQDDAADEGARKEALVLGRGSEIELALPKRGVYVLDLEARQAQALEPLEGRADLALSPLALKLDGPLLRGQVFNLGLPEAAEVVVALVDAGGKEIARKKLGKLAGVGDLEPKALSFEFDLPAEHAGCSVVADPDGKLDEIYEGNNRVPLPR